MRNVILAVAAALALPSLAFAQAQTPEQQICINLLNKGMNKVASTQAKSVVSCVADVAKGGGGYAFNCYDTDAKVDTAKLANCTAQSEKCTSAPTLGANNCLSGNSAAEHYVEKLVEDLFNAGPSQMITTCETDAAKCKCQTKVLKSIYKLVDARIKTFNLCKKNGLKNADTPITTTTELEACLSVDPKLQIENTQVKLDVAIDKNCTGIASIVDTGSCAGLAGSPFRNCVDLRTRCRVCRMVVESDNLDSGICDLYDDSVYNSSCTAD